MGSAGPQSTQLGLPSSVFAGQEVCATAGLILPDGALPVTFEQDVWDLGRVAGLPVQMSPGISRLDFTKIVDPCWRQVAKELTFALLAPRHPEVAVLPRALRTPLHLHTVARRLDELTRLFAWLTGQGVQRLENLSTELCGHYLDQRRYLRDPAGIIVAERGPATRLLAAQAVVALIDYRPLFTADRVPDGFAPWSGASPFTLAQAPSARPGNRTPALDDAVLCPLLGAALFCVETLGAHATVLFAQLNDPQRSWSAASSGLAAPARAPTAAVVRWLDQLQAGGQPLPALSDQAVRRRLNHGWDPDDPLLTVSLNLLVRQAGIRQFNNRWLPELRAPIETALHAVGSDKPLCRDAAHVERADGLGQVAWSLTLHRVEADALLGIMRTAAIIVIAAISGMRTSELMELEVGCRQPTDATAGLPVRHRITGRIVKGQPYGGTPDQWVVIEQVHVAVGLLEALHPDPAPGSLLTGRFSFETRYRWFRDWINSPEGGQRLGLAPIGDANVNLRALRRTLAIAIAYRPGGVLATKIHLKHVSVATTEGYAARPGGAQARLLAEISAHETQRNLELTLAEFERYRQGILPSGPGARELTAIFAHIDDPASVSATPPNVQNNDRDILNLLSRRAATLHLAPANYCWFTDPSKALCLRLANTPDADTPMVGMCDSTRCPQATHHPCHQPVWEAHAESTSTLLASIGANRKLERARLQAEHDRTLNVLADLDRANNPTTCHSPASGPETGKDLPCG